jgi:hypothetical protein
MNLLVKKQWLFILPAFFYFSCKKNLDNIGLPIKPQDSIGVFFKDSFLEKDSLIIDSWIVMQDSIVSSSEVTINNNSLVMYNNGLLVGNEDAGDLGQVAASSFLKLKPTASDLNFNLLQDLFIDSVYLSLYIYMPDDSETFVSPSKQMINVYQLRNPFRETTYYTSSDPQETERLIGSTGSFTPTRYDTLFCPLEHAIGKELLLYSNDTAQLYSRFPGLALLPDRSLMGPVLTFIATNDDNAVNIAFSYTDAGTSTRKSGIYKFSLGAATHAKYFIVKPDLSSTKLSALSTSNSIPTSQTDNICYVQSGSGIRTKISLPNIRNIVKGKTIIVNKAELVISPLPDPQNYVRPVLQLVKAEEKSVAVSVAPYASGTGTYVFNITSYLQSMLYKSPVVGEGLLLVPSELDDHFSTRRVWFYDAKNTNDLSKRIRLRVFYTEVK